MRKPFYVKSRKTWYVWLDGSQENLGPDKDAAHRKYHELMAGKEINGGVAVVKLLDAALDWMQKHRAGKTYSWYRDHLTSFAASVGGRLVVTDLKPHHVTKWLDAQAWGNNTKHRAIAAVQRVFNWARKEGYIVRNPLDAMEKPEATPRDAVVSEEHYKALIERTPDQAGKDFWAFLWETGCRVQEIRILSTAHFQRDERRFVIERRRAKGKRKPRVIYLNDAALAIVERRIAAQGLGVVFRHSRGKPWGPELDLCQN